MVYVMEASSVKCDTWLLPKSAWCLKSTLNLQTASLCVWKLRSRSDTGARFASERCVFFPKSKIGAADAAAGETPAPPFNYARPTRAHHARAEVVIFSLLQIFFEHTALIKFVQIE